ncbi:MAG: STAS domain-containing protein [Gaiellaceae bacterium]
MPVSSLDSAFREGVISVSQADGMVVVRLEGEFDLVNAQALAERLNHALTDAKAVIVDLDDVTFIDSTVIQVLVRTARTATEERKRLVLQLEAAAIVGRAIEIVGIERILPRAYDRQEALRIIQHSDVVNNRDGSAARLVAFTYVNTSIYEAATQSIAEGATWDFFCECGDPCCTERITLTQEGYGKLRDANRAIIAPGHRVDQTIRARALREDAHALRAQAQQQAKRARETLGRVSHEHE